MANVMKRVQYIHKYIFLTSVCYIKKNIITSITKKKKENGKNYGQNVVSVILY